MTRQKKLLVYGAILVIGLLIFVLELFVFQKPDGVLGLVICIISMLMIFVSVVKLCRMSPKFENSFLAALDILSWLP